MNEFFKKVLPSDVIALVVIVFGFYLLSKGVNTVVSGAVIAVVTYYFVSAKNRVNSTNSQSIKRDDGV